MAFLKPIYVMLSEFSSACIVVLIYTLNPHFSQIYI